MAEKSISSEFHIKLNTFPEFNYLVSHQLRQIEGNWPLFTPLGRIYTESW